MKNTELLVLGIGNILWADEGFGVRCVEVLNAEYEFDANVTIMDGGTQGLYLLPYIEDARRLIVFDAVDYGMAAGEMVVATDDDVPRFMGAKKMSLHQTGFQDVIATAQLLGRCPERLVLIGCQPVELEDYGGGLRPLTAARIDPAIALAVQVLADWGVTLAEGQSQAPDLADAAIRRGAYESGRPSAEEACRIGDDRFLPRAG